MSYNGSGTFQINTSGQPVVAGTVISATAFNALTADLATGLSTAITKDGQTTTTARIPFAAGINSTLTTDSSSVSTGSIITAGGIGAAKAAYIGTTLNVGGASTFTGAIAVDSVTDSSSTTTGSIQTDGGVGIAKALFVGTTANIAGVTTVQAGTALLPAITTTGDTNTGIFFPAADTIAFSEGGVESARIDSSGNVGIGQSANLTSKLTVKNSITFDRYGDATEGLTISTNSGNAVYNTFGGLNHVLQTAGTERARINSGGDLLVAITNVDPTLNRTNGAVILSDGSIRSRSSNVWSLGIATSSADQIQFWTDNGSARVAAGKISSNGSATAYGVGTSDYRLKENVANYIGGLNAIQALRPVSFTWKESQQQDIGFIAHEIQAIVPSVITGDKDAVDENGNPVYQTIFPAPMQMIANLVSAIQEQQAIITSLTDRITALEAK